MWKFVIVIVLFYLVFSWAWCNIAHSEDAGSSYCKTSDIANNATLQLGSMAANYTIAQTENALAQATNKS